MALAMQVERVDGTPPVAVIGLDGELDASNFEQLIASVRRAYDDGARGLVLDLAGLSFMASSGLFALHSAVRIMRGETPPDPEAGWGALHEMAGDHDAATRNVRLAAVREPIARVLERTGMAGLVGIDGSRSIAVAALRGA